MKIKMILFMCIGLCTYSYSQTFSLYTYKKGKTVVSCEDNLDNLFNNWNAPFIFYSNKIELFSYKYVKTLTSKSEINYYINWSTQPGTLINGSSISMKSIDGNNTSKSLKIHIVSWRNYSKEIEPMTKEEIKKMKKEYKNAMKKKIKIGDKVYIVKGKFQNKPFENYVFCNPYTHEIVWDNIFGSVEF